MSSGAMNWPFLMLIPRPVSGGRRARGRSAGRERPGICEHVAGLRDPFALLRLVDIGQDGQPRAPLHFTEHAHPFVEPGPAEGRARAAVRLVERGLEDRREAEPARRGSHEVGDREGRLRLSITHGPAMTGNGPSPPTNKPGASSTGVKRAESDICLEVYWSAFEAPATEG
jgi:hypothetical protein